MRITITEAPRGEFLDPKWTEKFFCWRGRVAPRDQKRHFLDFRPIFPRTFSPPAARRISRREAPRDQKREFISKKISKSFRRVAPRDQKCMFFFVAERRLG